MLRMIFGGAVITSEFVGASAQMIALPCCAGGTAAGAAPWAPRCATLRLHDACDLLLQLCREILRVGVAQVDHLRVAARLERRVEVCDQRAEAQALRFLAPEQDAVGAFVRDERGWGRSAFAAARAGLVQRRECAHEVACARVLERDYLDIFVTRLVDARDDAQHAINVGLAIGDDQRVRGGMRGEVTVLRHQRAQDRHELCCADVLHLDDLRDDLV
jgi:hypothetical protein